MTDVFTTEKRSWVMSRIRGKNTTIDLKMKGILSKINYSFEMYPKMYGNPDFILGRKKIAVFCDGNFWHGYKYHARKRPAGKFWKDKIEGNMNRDTRVSRKLRRDGWSVLRFWEHDIETKQDKCIKKILRKIDERRRKKSK